MVEALSTSDKLIFFHKMDPIFFSCKNIQLIQPNCIHMLDHNYNYENKDNSHQTVCFFKRILYYSFNKLFSSGECNICI